jgi:hypothetical protein
VERRSVSESIEPALDAEDWAVELAGADDFPGPVQPAGTFSGAVFVRDQRIAVSYDGGEAAQYVADDERHRLAALALYGQPFGFTRQDATYELLILKIGWKCTSPASKPFKRMSSAAATEWRQAGSDRPAARSANSSRMAGTRASVHSELAHRRDLRALGSRCARRDPAARHLDPARSREVDDRVGALAPVGLDVVAGVARESLRATARNR